MKKEYIRKTFKELHLYAVYIFCEKCNKERFFAELQRKGTTEWDALVECGNCSAIVAFDTRRIPEISDYIFLNIPANLRPGEEIKKWMQDQLQRFYESLPNCPRCNCQCFQLFRMRESFPKEPYNCKKCGTDLTKYIKFKLISKEELSIMDAWWYEVSEDNDENTGTRVKLQY